jgi:PHP family Zn ribbon phosphoesterase
MTNPKKDPIKQHETVVINVCDVCKTRYSLEEAKKRDMTCCGQRLKEATERISVPFGP